MDPCKIIITKQINISDNKWLHLRHQYITVFTLNMETKTTILFCRWFFHVTIDKVGVCKVGVCFVKLSSYIAAIQMRFINEWLWT